MRWYLILRLLFGHPSTKYYPKTRQYFKHNIELKVSLKSPKKCISFSKKSILFLMKNTNLLCSSNKLHLFVKNISINFQLIILNSIIKTRTKIRHLAFPNSNWDNSSATSETCFAYSSIFFSADTFPYRPQHFWVIV